MHYVYLLRSQAHPSQRYTGLTTDLKTRLQKHNEGGVPSTTNHRPWQLQTYLAFQTRDQAAQFEHYLKSGSGRAFANRHLWPKPPAAVLGSRRSALCDFQSSFE